MNEMRDHVAQAILDKLKADNSSWSYCDQDGTIKNVTLDGTFDLRELSKVAIAAMREPTREIWTALSRKANICTGTACDVWRATIDAALK
jgi:hypothetical protein